MPAPCGLVGKNEISQNIIFSLSAKGVYKGEEHASTRGGSNLSIRRYFLVHLGLEQTQSEDKSTLL